MDKLLTESDVAEILGVSPRTLQGWRLKGGGPSYHKLGRLVRYRLEDVQAFRDARRRRSTSDQPGAS